LELNPYWKKTVVAEPFGFTVPVKFALVALTVGGAEFRPVGVALAFNELPTGGSSRLK
jgi:hypothetical protein